MEANFLRKLRLGAYVLVYRYLPYSTDCVMV